MDELAIGPAELAQSLLRKQAGESPDFAHLVQAADAILQKLRRGLVPLIGDRGFGAVLGRSLRLAGQEVPSLKGIDLTSNGELELGSLTEKVEALGQDEAKAAVLAVLANVLGVLAQIMGREMTYRAIKG